MAAYYNENDPHAAKWLRGLIKRGLIADGVVDERSIEQVQPNELVEFKQCHFFAGIGGWSYAMRICGWPDGEPVWTGSCPCQPFSASGRRGAGSDKRHLWPEFRRLIAAQRPSIVFGEQTATSLGRQWLSDVRSDMEALGYAFGAADLCAAGVGAPHARQRLYWGGTLSSALANTDCDGLEVVGTPRIHEDRQPRYNASRCSQNVQAAKGRVAANDDPWSDADWIYCTDGKWRSVESGTFPLVARVPGRVGKLRGYGNAIVPKLAAAFIREFEAAWLESQG